MSDVKCCKEIKKVKMYGDPSGTEASVVGSDLSKLIEKNIRPFWKLNEFESNRMVCEDCGQVYGYIMIGDTTGYCEFRLPWRKKISWFHRFMLKYLLGFEWRWK